MIYLDLKSIFRGKKKKKIRIEKEKGKSVLWQQLGKGRAVTTLILLQ